jgi:DNA-directed RNA polymerase III subunit RPC8
MIYAGDGAAHVKVESRLVVFRPSIGEILIGKVKYCNDEGVHGETNLYLSP